VTLHADQEFHETVPADQEFYVTLHADQEFHETVPAD